MFEYGVISNSYSLGFAACSEEAVMPKEHTCKEKEYYL
jgi:hypothetical protein